MRPEHAQQLGLYAIAVVCGLACWAGFSRAPPLAALEYWLEDIRRLEIGSPGQPSRDVVVLAIGEGTLAGLPYRSPLDRGLLADVIDSLNAKGARAIVLDLFLDQATEPQKDQRLQRALADSRASVTVAWVPDAAARDAFTAAQRQWFGEFRRGAGFAVGDVSLSGKDALGVIRWMHVPAEGMPPLGAVAARSAGATVKPRRYRIDYLLPAPGGEPPIPVYEIQPAMVRAFPPAAWISGRVVVVGAVRPFEDRHLTPLNAMSRAADMRLPGALIHAHAIEQWVAPRPAIPRPPAEGLLLTLVVAALAVPLVFGKSAVWKRGVFALVGMALLEAVSLLLYQRGALALPILAPPAAFVLSAGLMSAWLSRRYNQQRRFLRETFGHYLAPAVVEHLISNPDSVRLGGEVREMSCLFTDIEEFTTLAESLPPSQLTTLMNEYLDGAVAILFAHEGTLDKFVGDAIVAFFGAPGTQVDHAERAVRCALALDRYARAFAQGQQERGVRLGRTRIGVHTGYVYVGNFGSSQHFNYTVLGDTVNTAARLESANKHLGTTIAISEVSAMRCNGLARRRVADILLKGKTRKISVWEPLHEEAMAIAYIAEYGAFIELVVRGELEAARALLRRLLEHGPEDPVLLLHLVRIEAGEEGLDMVLDSK